MLIAVVIVETMVLALLSVVVVALLRSHAEILRRLPEPEADISERTHDDPIVLSDGPRFPAHLPSPRRRATQARDISGTTLDGDAAVVSMAVGSNTVLAFLSTGCLTCRTFWDGLQPAVRTPLRELAPPDVQVVQSSRAWEDFGIEMSPYFCFVDGTTGEVRSEGAAMTWEQVASLLRDALLDEELATRT